MKFKPGQKVVCTAANSAGWRRQIDIHSLSFFEKIKLMLRGNKVPGPGFNEVVTVAYGGKPGFIPLKEYLEFGPYDERWFEPLVESAKIEKELSQIFEHQKN